MPDDTQPTSKDKQLGENNDQPTAEYEYQPVDYDVTAEHVSLAAIEAESGGIADTSTTTPDSSSVAADDQRPLGVNTFTQPSDQPAKKSKKGLVLSIIATLLVLALGGGGYTAYAWYQNPEKVITDGIVGAIQAKSTIVAGDFEFKSKSYVVKVTYDTRTSYESGAAGAATLSVKLDDAAEMKFGGEAMYMSTGDVYVKAKDVLKVYDTYIDESVEGYKTMAAEYGEVLSDAEVEQYRTQLDALYRPILVKVDNRWIKISADDIKQTDETVGKEYECVQNELKKLITDKVFAKQFRELYRKHKPLLIEKTKETKGNSVAYSIKENKNTSTAFTNEVKDLSAIKAVNECSESATTIDDYDSSSHSSDGKVTTEVKVWADKWNHAVTDFRVTADNKDDEFGSWNMVFNGQFSFNKPVATTAPSDAISLKELQEETDKITNQFQDSPATGDDVPATSTPIKSNTRT